MKWLVITAILLSVSAKAFDVDPHTLYVKTDVGAINLTLEKCKLTVPSNFEANLIYHTFASDTNQAEHHIGCWGLSLDYERVYVFWNDIQKMQSYDQKIFELKPFL